jgi:hypothetical protein
MGNIQERAESLSPIGDKSPEMVERIRHTDPEIDGDVVVGKTPDGKLKVAGDDGETRIVNELIAPAHPPLIVKGFYSRRCAPTTAPSSGEHLPAALTPHPALRAVSLGHSTETGLGECWRLGAKISHRLKGCGTP